MKICLILDSTTYRAKYLKDEPLKMVNLNVMTQKETYKELEMPIELVVDNLKKNVHMTTSQVAPGDFLKTYDECTDEGYTDVFVIPLSSGVSGTYQSANIAKSIYEGPLNIHIFETKVCSFGLENVTERILEIIKDENSLEEKINKVKNLLASTELGFTLGSLMHLYRGGRLSGVSALVGTVLHIKPIIEMVNGKLENTKKCRTHKNVIEHFTNIIDKFAQNYKKVYLNIIHLDMKEKALELKKYVEEKYNNFRTIITTELSPVFFIHIGLEGYGLTIAGEN